MYKSTFTFLNHASFMVESESAILVIDPWLEGRAFFNGWSLLDSSTSDKDLIEYLKKSRKKIFIWYSHEHSDHFVPPFLKKMKSASLDVKVLFHKTFDGRVLDFLKSQKIPSQECADAQDIELGTNFCVTTWRYIDGDSYSLVRCGDINILNLNDCVIDDPERASLVALNVSKKTNKIHMLLTQFGYANWIGGEADYDLRRAAALEKLERLVLQDKFLMPYLIIPFASFVYFCHKDNFYLNDAQNSPSSIRSSERISPLGWKMFFMMPWDCITLSSEADISKQLGHISPKAENHWNGLIDNIVVDTVREKVSVDEVRLRKEFNIYRRRVTMNFLFLPQLLEFFGLTERLRVFISDFNYVVELSYNKGWRVLDEHARWNVSLSSEVLCFILRNDFGFNTTHVNGRFRISDPVSYKIFANFFAVQEFYKNGYGLSHPVVSAKIFLSYFLRKFFIKLSKKTNEKTN